MTWLVVIIASVAAITWMFSDDDESAARKSAAQSAASTEREMVRLREAAAEKFATDKTQILAEIEALIAAENYSAVLNKTKAFLFINDSDLQQLHDRASRAKRVIDDANETQRLVGRAKEIPASNFRANKTVYSRLLELNPENESYEAKLAHYTAKIQAAAKKRLEEKEKIDSARRERLAKFGESPVASAWDGSYRAVTRYLEQIANDPDSIDIDACTKVYHIKTGWLVGCDYRGKNAFGATIRISNWFTIVHGRVTKMHDADAYSL